MLILILFAVASVTLAVLWVIELCGVAEGEADDSWHQPERGRGRAVIRVPSPSPGTGWIELHYYLLPPDEWVAANDSGLVASSPDLLDLLERLREMNVPRASVTVVFVQRGDIE